MSPFALRLDGRLYIVGGAVPPYSGNLPPLTPTDLSAVPFGYNGLTITWGAVSDPDGTVDRYEMSVNGETWTVASSPYTIIGLSPATQYSISVRAVDDKGLAGTPAIVSARTSSDPGNPEPVTITHGKDLPATSDLAETVIGAQGDLPEYMGKVDITSSMGPTVIENATIWERNIRVRSGANLTLRNVRIIGPAGSTTYTIRLNEGGNARLLLEDCTLVCRGGEGSTYPLAGWGATSLALRRTVVRGGIDGIHYHGKGPAIWPTGDPLIPLATFLMSESWIGDNERTAGSHSDLMQLAGARPNYITNFVWQRSRFMGYSLEVGQDTLYHRANPDISGYSSACWIDSTGGGTWYALRENWFEGGNNMIHGSGNSSAPAELTDNLFAPKARYGATSSLNGWVNKNNRWAYDGVLGNGTVCVGGELIRGSSE